MFFLIFLLFPSCVTAPKITDPFLDESGFLPLAPGASVYLLMDVPACRPFLDQSAAGGVARGQLQEILDRTKTAAAAFYPQEYERRFQVAAWGNYPGFRGSLALSAAKDWKKGRSKTGGAYHYSPGDGLSVALTASRAFAAGAGPGQQTDPFAPPPGVEVPEGFAEFRRGAALALWLDDPGPPVNRFFAAQGIPLRLPAEQILVSLFACSQEGEGESAGRKYEVLIQIRTPGASQARALLSLINLTRAMIPEMADTEGAAPLAAVFFANPPVQEGRNLNLRTRALEGEEIALLFKLFPVYSD